MNDSTEYQFCIWFDCLKYFNLQFTEWCTFQRMCQELFVTGCHVEPISYPMKHFISFFKGFNCGKLAMNNKIVTTLCSSTSHGITWKTISSQNRTMKICKKRLWFMNLSLSRCVYDVVVIYIMAQVVCYSSGHFKETKTNSTKGLDILLHSKTYYCSRIIKM